MIFNTEIQIMKYHDKVNLTSPIFKYNNSTSNKKLTKSPLKTSINPSDLFQKVCCPNCKYLFKIIKQEMIKQSPQLQTPFNKINKKQNKMTQTEGVLSLSNSNSPTKVAKTQAKFYKQNQLDEFQYRKKSQFNRLNQMLQQQNNQNKYTNESTFKFKPLSISRNNKKSKSSNSLLLKTLPIQKYSINKDNTHYKENQKFKNQYTDSIVIQDSFSNKQSQNSMLSSSNINRKYSRGLNSQQNPNNFKISTPKKLDQKIQQNNVSFVLQQPLSNKSNQKFTKKYKIQQQKNQQKSKSRINQSRLNQSNISKGENLNNSSQQFVKSQQFQLLLTQIVLKDQQNKLMIKQLQIFCQSISQEVQMPSYCKMLTFLKDEA